MINAKMKIFRCWRKFRWKCLCRNILSYGRKIVSEKKLLIEAEVYEYRLRIAHRRIEEDEQIRNYRKRNQLNRFDLNGLDSSYISNLAQCSISSVYTDRKNFVMEERSVFCTEDVFEAAEDAICLDSAYSSLIHEESSVTSCASNKRRVMKEMYAKLRTDATSSRHLDHSVTKILSSVGSYSKSTAHDSIDHTSISNKHYDIVEVGQYGEFDPLYKFKQHYDNKIISVMNGNYVEEVIPDYGNEMIPNSPMAKLGSSSPKPQTPKGKRLVKRITSTNKKSPMRKKKTGVMISPLSNDLVANITPAGDTSLETSRPTTSLKEDCILDLPPLDKNASLAKRMLYEHIFGIDAI